jgi:hypothetical protein
VQHYRVYKLNAGGRIVSGDWIEAENEVAARTAAHEMCDEATPMVELWQGARRIATLPCEDEAAA